MSIATGLYGLLTVASLAAVVVFAAAAMVYVWRLLRRPSPESGDDVGAAAAVMRKVRKSKPLSDAEARLATQVIADRRSSLAYAIPATIFSVGCFYVFGSLEQLHGGTPSERTFLGIIPMFTAANLTIQLLRSARLKKRVHA